MRRVLPFFLSEKVAIATQIVVFIAGCGGPTNQSGHKQASVLLDAAFAAHGIESRLPTVKTGRFMVRIRYFGDPQPKSVTDNYLFQLPSRFRCETTSERLNTNRAAGDGPAAIVLKWTIVQDDMQAWMVHADGEIEMTGQQMIQEVFPFSVPYGLTAIKKYRQGCSFLKENDLDTVPVVGIHVAEGESSYSDVVLDRETNLLRSLRIPARDVTDWKMKVERHEYREYRDYGGLQLPTRETVFMGNTKFSETELLEFELLDSVPPDSFVKPE